MPSRTVLLSTTAHKGGMITGIGVLAALGVIGLVFFGTGAVMAGMEGLDRMPDGFGWVLLGSLASGSVLCGIAGLLWWRNRIPVRLVESDGERFLEIDDPAGAVVLAAPFRIEFGWRSQHVPKGATMCVVQVGFFDDDRHVLTVSETWGALYGTPTGWPPETYLDHGDAPVYAAGGRHFLLALVDEVLPAR
jgi:hypothetical protein